MPDSCSSAVNFRSIFCKEIGGTIKVTLCVWAKAVLYFTTLLKEKGNSMFDSLLLNFTVFTISATVVWIAGSRLSAYLDEVSDRTKLGKAFVGVLFLGGATSLPEIATTITAATSGKPELAGSNLLGGLAMQIVVLAVVDLFALKGKALTAVAPSPALLMQGVVLVFITLAAIGAISVGELFIYQGIGLWSFLLMLIFVLVLYKAYQYEKDPSWQIVGDKPKPTQSSTDAKTEMQQKYTKVTTQRLVIQSIIAAIVILIVGYLITRTAEGIIEQANLSGNLVGATLLALATSLPEVSTTWSAVKVGAYSMAIANILGTNTIEVALFFPADVFYREGSILNAMGMQGLFMASLGAMITCIYLWGLLERRDRTILGMGMDSAAVLVVYLLGMSIYALHF